MKSLMYEQYDYFLVKDNERINKETGEVLKVKQKRLRHPLPTGNDKVDSNQSLRDYSLQRSIKANSSHTLSLSMLDEALVKFKDPLTESVKVLKLINKINYMNRVFLDKEYLLTLFDKSSNNLNKHLNRLSEYGVLEYEWSPLTAQYLITINPSVFFRGDDAYKELYEEAWLNVNTVSPLVSDETIIYAIQEASKVSVEDADKSYEESIDRSRYMSEEVSVPRQVFNYSDIDFAIKVRSERSHLPE